MSDVRRMLGRAVRWAGKSAAGVTGVEYALVVSLVLVGSIGAIETLGDNSRDEVNNQANCVSSRPPPVSCQLEPLVTTTTNSIPVTMTTAPTTSSTSTTTTVVNPSTVTITNAVSVRTGPSSWNAQATVTVLGPSGTPIAGAVIEVEVFVDNQGPFFLSCVTNASGSCQLLFNVPFANATQVRFKFSKIIATPPVASLPPDLLFPNPP